MAVATVRRELAALPQGWQVLHGVHVGGEWIDHLLTGPGGVVSLATKFHPRARVATDGRRMQVNGVDVDHLRRARITARRTAELITRGPLDHVPVLGGVVFVGLAEWSAVDDSPDALVTVADRVVGAVRQIPHVLSRSDVDLLDHTLQRCLQFVLPERSV